MAFAQLTYRESLRDIEACLRSQAPNLYHLGIRGSVSRSALSDANEGRDWQIVPGRARYRSDLRPTHRVGRVLFPAKLSGAAAPHSLP